MLTIQILGSILGILTAWLMDKGFTAYQNKRLEKLRLEHKQELENYKKYLQKTR